MNTHIPRVSIGLPVYNGEQFLKDAVDSLLAQTFRDFELIISDNGSTDATEEICRTYAARDQRIRYYRHEQNLGGSWNFKRVFDLSSAELFKWHSYDDLCAPELIAQCVNVLERMPSVVLCYARTTIIDENGKPVENHFDDLNLRSSSPYQRYKQYHERYHNSTTCNVQYGLIRRDVLKKTQLIAPYVNSDVNLIGELALRGEFYEIPDYLFFRRDHPLVSIRAFRTAEERIIWFDPTKKGKGSHPGWRMFFEQLRSITRVSMSWDDKMRCYLLAGRYFGWLAQGALRNVVQGAHS